LDIIWWLIVFEFKIAVMIYRDYKDLSAYKLSYELSNIVWDIVIRWSSFAKDTVGKQYVKAIDSISANIAEGFGRYNKKDKVHFYRYSFGSLKESMSWSDKSHYRGLLTEEQYVEISNLLDKLPKEINSLIKYTNDKLLK